MPFAEAGAAEEFQTRECTSPWVGMRNAPVMQDISRRIAGVSHKLACNCHSTDIKI